ncbi:hypothetical protein P1P75_11850 [Streptomyces sp. ID05-39B]|uniref:hypothetical protein n=1 Tax=Streptomyces sp. ID05-39B TaxID=3028664 RepID=UPI0029B3A4AC|nr:hypothetical protein [Streptomyces sp. ID05-39B]MDX3527117.1 hypothetical protein [Streptomyces sp. ID05-39B]
MPTEDTPKAAAERLVARYPLMQGLPDASIIMAIASTDYRLEWRDVAVRYERDFSTETGPASQDDALDALTLIRKLRENLDTDERRLIDMARREKATWPQIAKRLGLSSPQAAQQRRKRLENANLFADFLDPGRTAQT